MRYAEFGEAAGLVNMTDEAPENAGVESQRQRLLQRSRVLESCIAELEARRAAEPKPTQASRQALIGPQVAEHMSADIRSLSQEASLREAGRLMEQRKLGSSASARTITPMSVSSPMPSLRVRSLPMGWMPIPPSRSACASRWWRSPAIGPSSRRCA